MIKYLIKRVLVFIPTLIIISLLAFVISINAPGDPVERLLKSANKEGTANEQSNSAKKDKEAIRAKLGLDLPIFYLSLSTLADCDTLYKIADKAQQDNLLKLSRKYGNWEAVSNYYHATLSLLEEYDSLNVDKIYMDNTIVNYVENNDGKNITIDTVYESKYSKNEINDAKNNTSFDILSLLETYTEETIES
ncbi:MAG: hypothetical protein KDD24_03165, partial [Flavobacteriales bacterium]|nr:hypothetical protein [Flavobacteriales bacterium]